MNQVTKSGAETLPPGVFDLLGKIPGSIIKTTDLTVKDILI